MAITITPVTHAAVIYGLGTAANMVCSHLNNKNKIGKAPLTILGTVVAAVARKLVPNCSAAIVTKIAQKPVAKPSAAHITYMPAAVPFCWLK